MRSIVHEHRLATVCEEAKCPNIGECWNAGTATIMLMGAVCTRACRFCSVDTGNPRGWLDAEEPANVARSVALMKLKYIVLTSVNRDDLPDGGAAHYAACVRAIKERTPQAAVEALTPDFQGVLRDVETVVDSGLEVFAQNVETVRRLTHPVRDPRAGYEQTLAVLAHAKRHRPEVLTKTQPDARARRDRRRNPRDAWTTCAPIAVDILTLGQYLRPTRNHLPVERFVAPEEFDALSRPRRWRAAFANVSRARWCARAIAPSRRWPATTSASTTARAQPRSADGDARDQAGAARPGTEVSRRAALRADLARHAAHSPTRAARTRPMRSGCSSIRRCSRSA